MGVLANDSEIGTLDPYPAGSALGFINYASTGKIVKLTQDGKRNKVINGSTDWVYEEEFSIAKAYDWSPDSKYIAFLKFDEKAVPEFDMALYENELYPEKSE